MRLDYVLLVLWLAIAGVNVRTCQVNEDTMATLAQLPDYRCVWTPEHTTYYFDPDPFSGNCTAADGTWWVP